MERDYYSDSECSDQQYDETDSQKDFTTTSRCNPAGDADIAGGDAGNTSSVAKSKNVRRRKREFYNSIRNQMEFYFGDANLSKDRFLMQLIKKDPFIPLEVFLKFNKIKKLVTSTEDIAKALSYSKLLQLNDDKTKVCRTTEITRNSDDVDKRTIYVESLPSTANHDWVKNVFSRFGPVAYVSLPKFRISKKIKEFAFVEFENIESVEKAVNTFKTLGNLICSDSIEPEKLTSITSYIKEQNEFEGKEKEEENDVIRNLSDNKEKNSDKDESTIQLGKRSHSTAAVAAAPATELNEDPTNKSEEKEPMKKRQKLTEGVIEKNDQSIGFEDDDDDDDDEDKLSMISSDDLEDSIGATDDNDETIIQKKKKRRKRKKKTPKKTKSCPEFDLSNLRLLSKIDWKKLRNKYLNMQRKRAGEIKREIRKKQYQQHRQLQHQRHHSHHYQQSSQYNIIKKPPEYPPILKKITPLIKAPVSVQIQVKKPQSINFYGAGQQDTEIEDNSLVSSNCNNENQTLIDKNPAHQRQPLFTYEPGLILRIKLLEPCVNVKSFKADMKQYPGVVYVDVNEGSMEAFVRCETPKHARYFKRRISCAEYNCEILFGVLESTYWDKIMKDREMKLNKNVKVLKKRGREKIAHDIAKHIFFSDQD